VAGIGNSSEGRKKKTNQNGRAPRKNEASVSSGGQKNNEKRAVLKRGKANLNKSEQAKGDWLVKTGGAKGKNPCDN